MPYQWIARGQLMKWLRTMLISSSMAVSQSPEWATVHSSYVRAIQGVVHPPGATSLTLRKRAKLPNSQWKRNGVVELKRQFLTNITELEGWKKEARFDLKGLHPTPQLLTYPDFVPYEEPVTSEFGGFDFMTELESLKIAIEWETGNISSSHRSLNKLSIALARKKIDVGVLILPSRLLYEHLTDRVGNIGEISPYLDLWANLRPYVSEGLLAITVVEHDALTDDEAVPYLAVGRDGRAKEGRAKLDDDTFFV
jgi:hypothetical protein